MTSHYGATVGQCPSCGRFTADVVATIRGWGGDARVAEVHGTCRTHGRVDLSDQGWSWEDFAGEGLEREDMRA